MNHEFCMQNSEFRILNPECWIQNYECRILNAEFCIQVGCWWRWGYTKWQQMQQRQKGRNRLLSGRGLCKISCYRRYIMPRIVEFWIPNSEFRTLSSEFWVQNSEFTFLNSEFWIWNFEFGVRNSGFWIQNSEFSILLGVVDNKGQRSCGVEFGNGSLWCLWFLAW